jgi:hypothetical protein
MIPFLDVPVSRKNWILATRVYRKPTHTGWYLNLDSNHLSANVKKSIIQSFHRRASTKCQERQHLYNEINSLGHNLQVNSYSLRFIDSVINSKDSSHPSKGTKLLGSVYIP